MEVTLAIAASGSSTAAPTASKETAALAAAAGESAPQKKKSKKKSVPVPAHRMSGALGPEAGRSRRRKTQAGPPKRDI